MTRATEFVTAFMQALEAKEFTKAAASLSDSMILTGFTPAPLPKNQFINVMSGLAEGFPNLAYNLSGVEEVAETMGGNRIRGTVQITGSQVNSFKLPPLGIGPIPQMKATTTHTTFCSVFTSRRPRMLIRQRMNAIGCSKIASRNSTRRFMAWASPRCHAQRAVEPF